MLLVGMSISISPPLPQSEARSSSKAARRRLWTLQEDPRSLDYSSDDM